MLMPSDKFGWLIFWETSLLYMMVKLGFNNRVRVNLLKPVLMDQYGLWTYMDKYHNLQPLKESIWIKLIRVLTSKILMAITFLLVTLSRFSVSSTTTIWKIHTPVLSQMKRKINIGKHCLSKRLLKLTIGKFTMYKF